MSTMKTIMRKKALRRRRKRRSLRRWHNGKEHVRAPPPPPPPPPPPHTHTHLFGGVPQRGGMGAGHWPSGVL